MWIHIKPGELFSTCMTDNMKRERDFESMIAYKLHLEFKYNTDLNTLSIIMDC